MSQLALLKDNLLSPIVLSFALGLTAQRVKSDLKIPEAVSQILSIFLLIAIGLKGGSAAAKASQGLLPAALAGLTMAMIIPFTAYLIARTLGRFSVDDSASLAAHYGSTSAVTFLAALAFLESAKEPVEGFMPAILALMEIPAIAVALMLHRRFTGDSLPIGKALGHVLASKSLLLLMGGFVIGYASAPMAMKEVSPFFVDPFKGVLCLFLLDLGMAAGARLDDLKPRWKFLLPFAILLPLAGGILGAWLGRMVGLGVGGATALGVLSASASYIAAPAAVRIAIPGANPSLGIASALAVTFPFNLLVGLPTYYLVARHIGTP